MEKEFEELLICSMRMRIADLSNANGALEGELTKCEQTLVETFSSGQKEMYLELDILRNSVENDLKEYFYQSGFRDAVNFLLRTSKTDS